MSCNRKIIFVLGKGGVGKTTISSLLGLFFSNSHTINLYSFDQAHNLGDVLQVELNDRLRPIKENLSAAEVDVKLWKRKYLSQMKKTLKSAYSYLTAYNMLDFFDIMQEAPDIDQLSLLLAFDNIVRNTKEDIIIIDMPPTALALEFFRIVKRNIRWINALIELREKIQEKKEIISKIRLGKKEVETDKVLIKLYELKKFYLDIQSVINDSVLLVVQNPDSFSRLEAQRIIDALKEMKYANWFLIDNKGEDSNNTLSLPSIKIKNILEEFDTILAQNIDFFLAIEKVICV